MHHRIYVCDPAKASTVHVSTSAPLQGTIYHSGEATQGGLPATVINIPGKGEALTGTPPALPAHESALSGCSWQ